jgi:hypothetical integral membrane protein (TIGR02206 family)
VSQPIDPTTGAYVATVVLLGGAGAIGIAAARRSPTAARTVGRAIAATIAVDALSDAASVALGTHASLAANLPLSLCDAAAFVAAIACLWPRRWLVEVTWLWGMAGTLQAILTPDLSVRFPHLVFFEYLVGHVGVVVAALYLTVGLGIHPRRSAPLRVLAISAVYTGIDGLVDWATGANYMFLRHPPAEWTMLRLLGPWPWYILSAVPVALVLFWLLTLPFMVADRRRASRERRNPAPVASSMPSTRAHPPWWSGQ